MTTCQIIRTLIDDVILSGGAVDEIQVTDLVQCQLVRELSEDNELKRGIDLTLLGSVMPQEYRVVNMYGYRVTPRIGGSDIQLIYH